MFQILWIVSQPQAHIMHPVRKEIYCHAWLSGSSYVFAKKKKIPFF